MPAPIAGDPVNTYTVTYADAHAHTVPFAAINGRTKQDALLSVAQIAGTIPRRLDNHRHLDRHHHPTVSSTGLLPVSTAAAPRRMPRASPDRATHIAQQPTSKKRAAISRRS